MRGKKNNNNQAIKPIGELEGARYMTVYRFSNKPSARQYLKKNKQALNLMFNDTFV